ncbi:MAG: hypothetical protein KGO50_01155 [Myxococcales bacterium]|nr:hypothetical protein [Myxococcales bacterium]
MTAAQFLNVSNHPVEHWGRSQLESLPGGCVTACDYQGPLLLDPQWSTDAVCGFAQTVVGDILAGGWKHVHVAGEPALVLCVVTLLQCSGVCCWQTTSERQVSEVVSSDGSVRKESRFHFVQWRMYPEVRQLIRTNTK